MCGSLATDLRVNESSQTGESVAGTMAVLTFLSRNSTYTTGSLVPLKSLAFKSLASMTWTYKV
jgi:hypothetical protein